MTKWRVCHTPSKEPALLPVFISKWPCLFPLPHHSHPSSRLRCFNVVAPLLFFSKKETGFLVPSSPFTSTLVGSEVLSCVVGNELGLHSSANLENIWVLSLWKYLLLA